MGRESEAGALRPKWSWEGSGVAGEVNGDWRDPDGHGKESACV